MTETARRPTISAVIPAYNEERWIGEALDSLLAQTDPADEIIVVDDGSTDDTLRVVRGYGESVRVFAQENAGCAAAFNRGFREAAGDYVALCPADDIYEPERVALQRRLFESRPDVDVVFGLAFYFGLRDDDFPRPPSTGVLDNVTLLPTMYWENVIPDPSAVVRRALHHEIGGYLEIVGEDYDFWMRALAADAVFACVPQKLVGLRLHGGNLSLQALTIWENNYRVHLEHAERIPDRELVRRTLARDLVRIAHCRAGVGHVAEARDAYWQAFKLKRSMIALAGAVALGMPGAGWAARSRAARRGIAS